MTTIAGKLDAEDLMIYRGLAAKREAMQRNPRAYSGSEHEQLEMQWFRFFGTATEKYGLDDSRAIGISAHGGTIIYGSWD